MKGFSSSASGYPINKSSSSLGFVSVLRTLVSDKSIPGTEWNDVANWLFTLKEQKTRCRFVEQEMGREAQK